MTYNGHKNWDYWNVSLWIGNDEGLYNLARSYARRHGTARERATLFLNDLNNSGITETPDGAQYTVSNIVAAMRDL